MNDGGKLPPLCIGNSIFILYKLDLSNQVERIDANFILEKLEPSSWEVPMNNCC